MNRELPNVQAGFRKGRGSRDQIANICWIIEKAKEFQKNVYFCFIDYANETVMARDLEWKSRKVILSPNFKLFIIKWEVHSGFSLASKCY